MATWQSLFTVARRKERRSEKPYKDGNLSKAVTKQFKFIISHMGVIAMEKQYLVEKYVDGKWHYEGRGNAEYVERVSEYYGKLRISLKVKPL